MNNTAVQGHCKESTNVLFREMASVFLKTGKIKKELQKCINGMKHSHVLNMPWIFIMRSHAIFILFLHLLSSSLMPKGTLAHTAMLCNIAVTVITAQHFCGTKRRPPLDLWIARKYSFHLPKVRSTILRATQWASLKSTSMLLTGLVTGVNRYGLSGYPLSPSSLHCPLWVLGLLAHRWVAKNKVVMHIPRPPCNNVCDQTLMITDHHGGWLLDNLCGMHIHYVASHRWCTDGD